MTAAATRAAPAAATPWATLARIAVRPRAALARIAVMVRPAMLVLMLARAEGAAPPASRPGATPASAAHPARSAAAAERPARRRPAEERQRGFDRRHGVGRFGFGGVRT